jgi:hypothetical protein
LLAKDTWFAGHDFSLCGAFRKENPGFVEARASELYYQIDIFSNARIAVLAPMSGRVSGLLSLAFHRPEACQG